MHPASCTASLNALTGLAQAGGLSKRELLRLEQEGRDPAGLQRYMKVLAQQNGTLTRIED